MRSIKKLLGFSITYRTEPSTPWNKPLTKPSSDNTSEASTRRYTESGTAVIG
jgi:hypothetical protein